MHRSWQKTYVSLMIIVALRTSAYETNVDLINGVPLGTECPLEYFRCGNSTRCLAQKHWCDGQNKECDGGEDEDVLNCVEQGGFHGDFINRYENITLIADRPDCDLAFVPPICGCKYGTRIWCGQLGLTTLPKNIPYGVTHLYLLENEMSLTPYMFVNITSLRQINLNQNNITHFPVNTFYGLNNLEKLLLEENRIRRLEADMFAHLKNLHWLFLQNNQIEYIAPDVFKGLENLYWLNLGGNRLRYHYHEMLPLNPYIQVLDLDRNRLIFLGPKLFTQGDGITALFLPGNQVREVDEDIFANMTGLLELSLSVNNITTLPQGVFRNNQLLENLNLSHNPMEILHQELFDDLSALNSIDLRGIEIQNIDVRLFAYQANLQHIYFETFQYCRYVPHVRRCEPKGDGISSFDNLLEAAILRVAIWLVACVCLVGNIAVFFVRCLIKTDSRVHSIIIKHLCVCDFLMGVYLLILASHDMLYRNTYNEFALEWMFSWNCIGAGALAVISAQVSISIVLLMSVERFITITYPYKYWRLSCKGTCTLLGFLWTFGILVAVVPLLWHDYFGEYYSINGVCLPLHIHDPYLNGWQYSAAVFLGFNSVCLLTVIFCYVSMFTDILRTGRNVHRQMYDDMVLAKRFVLIVFTDACCWLPIIIVKLLAFSNYSISNDCYAWMTVFVLPLNSALNPVVYSLSTPFVTRRLSTLLTSGDKSEQSTRNNSLFLGGTDQLHSIGQAQNLTVTAKARSDDIALCLLAKAEKNARSKQARNSFNNEEQTKLCEETFNRKWRKQ